MINQTGGTPQFPNNILQSGQQQQIANNQQNQVDKRSQENKPQQNRSAESSASQNTNKGENRNFQEIAQSILAQRQEGAVAKSSSSSSEFKPAVARGSVVDITV